MNFRLQIIIMILSVAVLFFLFMIVKRRKLELRYALIWIIIDIIILIFDLFPELLSFVAGKLGIEIPSNMLFFSGICFILIILFLHTLTVSKMSNKINRLSQELAIITKKIEDNLKE